MQLLDDLISQVLQCFRLKVRGLGYSKVSPRRKGGLWALGGFSNSELAVGRKHFLFRVCAPALMCNRLLIPALPLAHCHVAAE